MKIIRLQAEGFKRLVAVDITPEGGLVRVGGDNMEGKSSLLDSIYAALGGAEGAPIKPVRTGEEYALIKVDMGDVKVTRYFGEDGTTSLKVENAEGAVYGKAQTKLDDLVGRIAFDPLAFAKAKPVEQAAELLRLVPIKVDLAESARLDKADIEARRDVNRDGKALKARFEAINISGIIPEKPDREAIVSSLASAGETNAAIQRDITDRETRIRRVEEGRDTCRRIDEEIRELETRILSLRERGAGIIADGVKEMEALEALPPIAAPVDTAKLSDDLAQADRDLALLARVEEKKTLEAGLTALRVKSEAFTTAIETRAAARAKALAEAEMPVPGLGFGTFGDSEDLVVTYEGEPFSQASGAQQLRVSMALAMAANPTLRVMIIKDGSLLDPKGLALVRDLAEKGDYQVWLETVGEGEGTGIIMEAGKVRGAGEPERVEPPKRRKKAEDAGDGESLGSATNPEHGATVDTSRDEDARQPEAVSARRKPAAMREFSTPVPGGLFGDQS